MVVDFMVRGLLSRKPSHEMNSPRHIAVVSDGRAHSFKSEREKELFLSKRDLTVIELMKIQIELNVPIFTISVSKKRSVRTKEGLESIERLFSLLLKQRFITSNQVKISVLGKWYDLPGHIVEAIKSTINNTKDYDRFFFNICINYDGQEEIVDSCRLIARMIEAGKIKTGDITKELIKENIYSSYFLPPEIIILTSGNCKTDLLLWDSAHSHICSIPKDFMDLTKKDIVDAIRNI